MGVPSILLLGCEISVFTSISKYITMYEFWNFEFLNFLFSNIFFYLDF